MSGGPDGRIRLERSAPWGVCDTHDASAGVRQIVVVRGDEIPC
eukprot:COSAG02_NODE_328_length_24547_cov_4.124141_33_plen_42_part_01